MTLAEQDQIGRDLTDINKRLHKLEAMIEKLTASRAIHMDSVGTPKIYDAATAVIDRQWTCDPKLGA